MPVLTSPQPSEATVIWQSTVLQSPRKTSRGCSTDGALKMGGPHLRSPHLTTINTQARAVKGRMGGGWSICALQTPQEISVPPPPHPYPRTPPAAVPLCPESRVRALTYFQNVRVRESPVMLPGSAPVLKEHSPTFLQKGPCGTCVCLPREGSGEWGKGQQVAQGAYTLAEGMFGEMA